MGCCQPKDEDEEHITETTTTSAFLVSFVRNLFYSTDDSTSMDLPPGIPSAMGDSVPGTPPAIEPPPSTTTSMDPDHTSSPSKEEDGSLQAIEAAPSPQGETVSVTEAATTSIITEDDELVNSLRI
ncbi:hypothetical protein ElyMa_000807600 [Elysia marginata]|uniref:Uncharacterized protein n=1 Tax=Elysia marginata TaxID=1093978 RepID=A0AAV4GWH0_9GAST|nr:hypothetical protein ElyMa_000807600 [Elysia marginata]